MNDHMISQYEHRMRQWPPERVAQALPGSEDPLALRALLPGCHDLHGARRLSSSSSSSSSSHSEAEESSEENFEENKKSMKSMKR